MSCFQSANAREQLRPSPGAKHETYNTASCLNINSWDQSDAHEDKSFCAIMNYRRSASTRRAQACSTEIDLRLPSYPVMGPRSTPCVPLLLMEHANEWRVLELHRLVLLHLCKLVFHNGREVNDLLRLRQMGPHAPLPVLHLLLLKLQPLPYSAAPRGKFLHFESFSTHLKHCHACHRLQCATSAVWCTSKSSAQTCAI